MSPNYVLNAQGTAYETSVSRPNFKNANQHAVTRPYKNSKITTLTSSSVNVYNEVKSEIDAGRPIVLHLNSNT